ANNHGRDEERHSEEGKSTQKVGTHWPGSGARRMLSRPAGPHCHPWGALRRNATRRWSPMPTFLRSIILAGVLAAVANPAAAQIPRLKKLKDAAKKVAKQADTAQVKPADSTAAEPAAKPAAKPDP